MILSEGQKIPHLGVAKWGTGAVKWWSRVRVPARSRTKKQRLIQKTSAYALALGNISGNNCGDMPGGKAGRTFPFLLFGRDRRARAALQRLSGCRRASRWPAALADKARRWRCPARRAPVIGGSLSCFDSLMALRPDPLEAVHHGGLGHAKRQPSRDLAL